MQKHSTVCIRKFTQQKVRKNKKRPAEFWKRESKGREVKEIMKNRYEKNLPETEDR